MKRVLLAAFLGGGSVLLFFLGMGLLPVTDGFQRYDWRRLEPGVLTVTLETSLSGLSGVDLILPEGANSAPALSVLPIGIDPGEMTSARMGWVDRMTRREPTAEYRWQMQEDFPPGHELTLLLYTPREDLQMIPVRLRYSKGMIETIGIAFDRADFYTPVPSAFLFRIISIIALAFLWSFFIFSLLSLLDSGEGSQ